MRVHLGLEPLLERDDVRILLLLLLELFRILQLEDLEVLVDVSDHDVVLLDGDEVTHVLDRLGLPPLANT